MHGLKSLNHPPSMPQRPDAFSLVNLGDIYLCHPTVGGLMCLLSPPWNWDMGTYVGLNAKETEQLTTVVHGTGAAIGLDQGLRWRLCCGHVGLWDA